MTVCGGRDERIESEEEGGVRGGGKGASKRGEGLNKRGNESGRRMKRKNLRSSCETLTKKKVLVN